MNLTDPNNLTLDELAALTGESTRTIRYYTQEGLLSSPGLGRGVRYGPEHVDRLLLIQALQQMKQPLAKIREVMASLTPDGVRNALLQARKLAEMQKRAEGGRAESAAEYAERFLSSRALRQAERTRVGPSGQPVRLPIEPALPAAVPWDRYVLSPEVEIHVRRPLSNPDQRSLRKLVRFGRELFEPQAQSGQAPLFAPPSDPGDSEP